MTRASGEKIELKPCPFCGGEAEEGESLDYEHFTVVCWACVIDGPAKPTREEANEAWNRRVKSKED